VKCPASFGLSILVLPLVFTGLLGPSAGAQRRAAPKNDPAACPYCGGDQERMAAGGLVSHGGFEFATGTTGTVDAFLATSDLRWIESAHFEIGFGLGSYRVGQTEKKKILAELTELSKVLPAVKPKTKTLDPWLRAHLFAQRAEKTYARFQSIMGLDQANFPDGNSRWIMGTKYMGEGPHMGQKGKYELLIVPTASTHVAFLTESYGLQFKRTQRWNLLERDTLSVSIHTQEEGLRVDSGLHCHVVFNLSHNLLDGYKHYSYDTPIWIHEGLAHVMEREISPSFNSFDSDEGSVAEKTRKSKWTPEVRKLISSKKVLRLAELVALKSYAELELRHHYTTWSMVLYLMEEHAEAFANLNDRLHGMKKADGLPDGSKMRDKHRRAFQDCLGMSYAQFDKAWRNWAATQ